MGPWVFDNSMVAARGVLSISVRLRHSFSDLEGAAMDTRQRVFDGDDVVFAIKWSGQAMAVPPGGKADAAQPILTTTLRRDGKAIWSGVVQDRVRLDSVPAQFTDEELRQFYRKASARDVAVRADAQSRGS